MGKYHGFESYLETGEFTPEFMHDYEYWCRKIFRRWTLFVDFDAFYGQCWEALLSKIKEFDPNIATIQTFCISRINNEAWRRYMKNKTVRPEVDCDSPVMENTLTARDEVVSRNSLVDFALWCKNARGVDVDLDALYADCSEGIETPASLVYAWWKTANL